MSDFSKDVAEGKRFQFGRNWRSFLSRIDERKIEQARNSFVEMLTFDELHDMSFLDIGCGSGLSSLVARRLGARVHSFDYDPGAVTCCSELKRRYFPNDERWTIEKGSILDEEYVGNLGRFDIVYSWGVLHHTGNLWEALENTARLTSPNGWLFISLYNDQGWVSDVWRSIKRTYCRLPLFLKWTVVFPCFLRLWGPTMVKDLCRLRPFRTWTDYGKDRGMSAWHDVIDWVGGYPFEVAKPEEVFRRVHGMKFHLVNLKTSGGGRRCNEYIFRGFI